MNRMAVLAAVIVAGLASGLAAQTPRTNPPATTASACPPTTTLDELIKAIDEAVSGPGDKDRTCMRAIMLPEARLTPIRKADDGAFSPRMLTIDDWITAVAKRGSAVFYERQVKVKSETYGHIAHLWSTYETRSTPDGKADVRGINSIQAVFDGHSWHVLQILWQAETPAEPVPEKYLP